MAGSCVLSRWRGGRKLAMERHRAALGVRPSFLPPPMFSPFFYFSSGLVPPHRESSHESKRRDAERKTPKNSRKVTGGVAADRRAAAEPTPSPFRSHFSPLLLVSPAPPSFQFY